MLHKFFAVTQTSVYRVTDEYREDGMTPIVDKIALRGESEIPTGEGLKRILSNNGHVVAVTKSGIRLYHPNHKAPINAVNTFHHGGHTTPVVGLFLDKGEAMECFATGSEINLDPSWQSQTEAVLDAIGEDHKVFKLSHDDYDYAIAY